MGNYRFRLSDMMPNAWFYKLKDMGRATRNQSTSHSIKRTHTHRRAEPTTPKPHPPSSNQSFLPNRASYYFPRSETEKFPNSPTNPKATDTHFPLDPPRKSKRKSRRTPLKPSTKLITSSVSSGCSCRVMASESPYSDEHEDDDLCKSIIGDEFEFDSIKSWSRSCSCRLTSSATDIIIDVGSKSSFTRKLEKFEELELPPILTKPTKKEAEPVKLGGRIETTEKLNYINGSSTLKEQSKSPSKRSPAGLHRLRIRGTSPRFASKKIQAYRARRSSGLSESFAIVKSSSDPQRDFRDSMVEMIVENNIRASKDLEELLACYLTLNSNEYHDVIVKVFEQIWFDLAETIRL